MKFKFLKADKSCETRVTGLMRSPLSMLKTCGVSLMAFAVSSCGNQVEYSEPLTSDCFATPIKQTSAFSPKMPEAMNIYLDTSVSSTRYGRDVIDSPYRDMIALILEMARDEGTHSLYGFANKIAPVDRTAYLNAAKGKTGVCSKCGQEETRLDDLLNAISRNPDGAANIIITDLWLDNKELIESRLLTLGNPIRDLMGQGKTIGVVGIKAPYRHEVYDIPRVKGSKILPAGKISDRPFFVLVIGDLDEVSGFYRQIESDLLSSLEEGSYNFSIFSSQTPSSLKGISKFSVKAPEGLLSPGGFSFEGPALPNFRVDTRKSNQLYDRSIINNMPAEFAGLLTPLKDTNSLSFLPAPSQYGFRSQAYSLEASWDDACNPDPDFDAWEKAELDGLMSVQTLEGSPYFGLNFSNEAAALLPIDTTYWLDVDVYAAKAPTGQGQAQWMEEWGFRPGEGEALYASPPAFFPTLNLEAFRDLLNKTAAENSKPNQPIANINIILSTD